MYDKIGLLASRTGMTPVALVAIMVVAAVALLGVAPANAQSLLWNKLGSDAEVTNSEIGPDGVIVGDISYYPGFFGNGFKSDPRTGDPNIPDNFVKFDGLVLGEQGTIEFWYQPDWVSGGHIREILQYGRVEGSDAIALILFHYNDWQNRLYFQFWDGDYPDTYAGVWRSIVPGSTPEWSTTEPFHVAVVWDGTAAADADKVRLYLNGNERGTLNVVGGAAFDNWGDTNDFFLGSRVREGDWYRHNWEGADGVIDNFIIYDYAKTDFSDRFDESPVMPTVAFDIKPGSCPNPLNLGSRGVIPAAILGTASFDVAQIDPASIRLEGVAPIRSSHEDVAGPFEPFTGKEDCALDCNDYGPDGFMDLTLKFKTQQIVEALGELEDGFCRVMTLTANLREEFGGAEVVGEDVVIIKLRGGGGMRLNEEPRRHRQSRIDDDDEDPTPEDLQLRR